MFRNLDTFSSHISSICLSVIGSGDLAHPDPLCTSEDVDGTCFHSIVKEEKNRWKYGNRKCDY